MNSIVSTSTTLSSTTISTISDNITNVVGARLEDQVHETVMKALAEMAHTYFPKVAANHSNDMLDLSELIIPPCRLQQLRHFLRNPTAQFSCHEQAVLLELMLRRTQNVLAVLGTGLGKTLAVLMQATLQNDLVTIVVLPMSSLHDDFKRRALELGVSYSRWNTNGKFNPDVNVISVSIEHLGFSAFANYVYFFYFQMISCLLFYRFISELEHNRRLGPLVFDEIHKLLTDSDYRNAFDNFRVLHMVKGVVFGLTGSLPPSLYPAFCEFTRMTWRIIRTPSSRKELKYQVVKVSSENELDTAIITYLNSVVPIYRSNERAMVFCRSRDQARRLATLLNVQPYYAVQKEEEMEVNEETMKKWRKGENKVMVCTSFLGCGWDQGHVRDVVHRDPSYTMIDQYQEDSRGGRDGLECRATTFVVNNKQYRVTNSQYDLGSKALFDSMHDDHTCRRTAPTLYLDGRPAQCITIPGAIFCEICESQSTITSAARNSSPPCRVADIFNSNTPRRIDFREMVRQDKKRSRPGSRTSSISSLVIDTTYVCLMYCY